MRLALALALVYTLAILSAGCEGTQRHVYVVPDGYRGELTIEKSGSGQTIECVDGVYTFEFEPSGKLLVKNYDDFVGVSMVQTARFKNGTPIKVPIPDGKPRVPSDIEFRMVEQVTGNGPEGAVYTRTKIFVGTAKEWDER